MKKALKISLKVLGIIILLAVVAGLGGWWYINSTFLSFENDYTENTDIKELTIDGFTFLDRNGNSKLDIYEDNRNSTDDRIENALHQMTLEEKAGMLFVTMIGTTSDGEPMETPVISTDPIMLMMSFMLPSNSEMIARKKMNSFNTLASLDADLMAKYNNKIQKMAEMTAW